MAPWKRRYLVWPSSLQDGSLVLPTNMNVNLRDFKPYTELYSLKVITNSTVQAAVISFLPVLNEFNAYTLAGKISRKLHSLSINLSCAGNDPDTFDWGGKIKPCIPNYIPSLGRLYSILCIKKAYQYYCVNACNSFLAAAFTKDIAKSASRKLIRYGRSSYFVFETFGMCLKADFLYRLSLLTFDTGAALYEWVLRKRRELDIIFAFKWFAKKTVRIFLGSIAASIGFAVGSLVEQKYLVSALLMTVSDTMMNSTLDLYLEK